MVRPFRFGLLVESREQTRQGLLDLARRAEDEGYAILLGTDHLGRLATVPLIQTAAEHTRLRIGTLVLNNDFRHPALLAQELASLDVVTEGRLEIGLGAGWARDEYVGAAVSFDRPGRRVARLEAAVTMLKQSLSEGRIDWPGGDAYPPIHLEDMPLSVQRPHPPLLIGGGGPRVLRFAAREAAVVGLDPRALPGGGHDRRDVTAALFDEKLGWIREAAGDRWAELEVNIIIMGVDREFRPGRGRSPVLRHDISDAEMADSPHYLTGSVEAMVEQLLARRERWGINYLAVREVDMDLLTPLIARLGGGQRNVRTAGASN